VGGPARLLEVGFAAQALDPGFGKRAVSPERGFQEHFLAGGGERHDTVFGCNDFVGEGADVVAYGPQSAGAERVARMERVQNFADLAKGGLLQESLREIYLMGIFLFSPSLLVKTLVFRRFHTEILGSG